jgi:hypothetical protein
MGNFSLDFGRPFFFLSSFNTLFMGNILIHGYIILFNPSSFNTLFMGNDYRRPQTLSRLHSSNTLFAGNGLLKPYGGPSPPHSFNTLFAGNRAQLPNFLLLQHLLPSHLFRTRISLCCI